MSPRRLKAVLVLALLVALLGGGIAHAKPSSPSKKEDQKWFWDTFEKICEGGGGTTSRPRPAVKKCTYPNGLVVLCTPSKCVHRRTRTSAEIRSILEGPGQRDVLDRHTPGTTSTSPVEDGRPIVPVQEGEDDPTPPDRTPDGPVDPTDRLTPPDIGGGPDLDLDPGAGDEPVDPIDRLIPPTEIDRDVDATPDDPTPERPPILENQPAALG